MKHDIITVDAQRGIVQHTCSDERWYARRVNEGTVWDFVPSVTWICSYFPKGKGFLYWMGKHGYEEAEEIKAAAGDRGSKVHQAVSILLSGGTVRFDDDLENPRSNEPEPISADEYLSVMSFCEWCEEEKPQLIDFDYTVWNEKYRYAGTVDLKCRIQSDDYRHIWIIDLKTSSEVWPSHEMQVSAYQRADEFPRADRTAILQLGYKRNKKKKFKFTRTRSRFKLFLATRKVWAHETAGRSPLQREYPVSLSLSPVVCLKQEHGVTGAEA